MLFFLSSSSHPCDGTLPSYLGDEDKQATSALQVSHLSPRPTPAATRPRQPPAVARMKADILAGLGHRVFRHAQSTNTQSPRPRVLYRDEQPVVKIPSTHTVTDTDAKQNTFTPRPPTARPTDSQLRRTNLRRSTIPKLPKI